MKNRLLALSLMGLSLFATAQQQQPKPARDFKSPALLTVHQQRADQDGKAVLREKLELKAIEDLRIIEVEKDKIGFTHQKFQHYYEGIKVFGSQYTVHSIAGKIAHLSGNYARVQTVDLNPDLSSDAALEEARMSIEATKVIWDEDISKKPTGELMIFDAATTGDEARLVYKFEVIALKPYQRYDVFVDAKTGGILKKYSKIHFADAVGTAATRYSGSQSIHADSYSGGYRLRDYSRGNGIISWDATTATSVNFSTGVPVGSSDYTDGNNNWTASEFDNSDKDDAGLEAHFGAAATYDFFYSNFGRDSYNGSGAIINSHVNTDIEDIYGYPAGYNDNAFWNGYVMVYGKGGSLDPLTTIDITAHEIGHAFMEYTAGMVYEKEAGAMNESFSDIWGTCVENYVNVNHGTSKDLWNLGSETGATFRSMSNPNAYNQPDTYGGSYWVNVSGCTPGGGNDYCGVHTNSGVGNHWFYILTVGKSGTNDNSDSYSVTGIGIDKAAAISWRSQSVYLGPNDTYSDWRTYSVQSAIDLYGAGSAEEIAVTNAWYAVGVGSEFSEPVGCISSPLALSITLDNYPEETSWTVKNSSGTTVASGGTYGSQSDGSTVNVPINLTDGDYTFTIQDAYGDGICCSYGSGSYSLSSGSTTVVSGGSFSSSESTSFCVSSGPDTEDPTAPSGLTASGITETTVDLSWSSATDNVGVTGYKIYRGSTNIGTVTGTSTTATGLTAGNTYSFHVTAIDAASNESGSSNTVNVTTLTPDNTPPSVPTGLSATNVTQTSLTLSWNAASDNVGVTGYDVYRNGSFLKSASGTSTGITGLSASTTYSFAVRSKDAAGNTSSLSSALNVTTDANSVTYCPASGNNSSYEWIDLIQLGSINNATGSNGGYGDFTSQATSLAVGSTNTLYLSAGFNGSSYTERWRIWVDFNRDGDFSDSGELVISGNTSNGSTYSANFSVPGGAALGSARMRVAMAYNANPSSCGTFTYGEVEDYLVNIISGTFSSVTAVSAEPGEALEHNTAISAFGVYPNPVMDMLRISKGELKEVSELCVIDMGGQQILQVFEISESAVDVSELKPGLYILEIRSERGSFQTKFLKR